MGVVFPSIHFLFLIDTRKYPHCAIAPPPFHTHTNTKSRFYRPPTVSLVGKREECFSIQFMLRNSHYTRIHTQTFELNRSNNRDPRRVFFAHVSTDVFSAAGGAKNNGPKYFSNPASLERTTKRSLPTLPPCNKRQSVEARIYASRPSEAGERTKQPFSRMLISDRRRSSCDTRYFPQLNPNIKGGRERKNCPSANADIIACEWKTLVTGERKILLLFVQHYPRAVLLSKASRISQAKV